MDQTKKVVLHDLAIERPLQIQSISSVLYYRYSPSFVFEGEQHRQWEFVYVDKGAVIIESDQKTYALKAGSYFLHRPSEFHKIKADQTSSDVFIMTFLLKKGGGLLSPLSDQPHEVNEEEKELLLRLLEENRLAFAGTDFFAKKIIYHDRLGSLEIIASLLEDFLLLGLRPKENENPTHPTNPLFEKIVLSIQKHLASPACLREVSSELGYSEGYVSKFFARQGHVSVKEYQLNLRLEKAKSLLFERNKSLSDIADELGFSSLQHFSKIFKQKTHYSPSRYRDAALSKNLYDPFVNV
jgi:AraC-like DNA-binding protein